MKEKLKVFVKRVIKEEKPSSREIHKWFWKNPRTKEVRCHKSTENEIKENFDELEIYLFLYELEKLLNIKFHICENYELSNSMCYVEVE